MTTLRFADDYGPEYLALVKETCLYVFPELTDLIDQITIVGGAVPALLIGDSLPPDVPTHVGSADLDMSLALTFEKQDAYRKLVERLQRMNFEPRRTSDRSQGTRWQKKWNSGKVATIDVLPLFPRESDPRSEAIPALPDAIARPLPLALQDRQRFRLSGKSVAGNDTTVEGWVCGPGAFVIIKALTFRDRGFSKDAYDLYYVLRHYGTGVSDVVDRLAPLLKTAVAREGIQTLEQLFSDEDEDGAKAVANFMYHQPHAEIQADVVGFVRQLLQACGVNPP